MKTLPTAPMPKEQRYEAAVAKLTRLGVRVAPRTAWKESFGSMEGREHFDEAVRRGAEWREEMNREDA